MKTQIAELVTGDFEENTLTLEVDREITVQAGKYAIVPIDEYQKLVNGVDKETKKALAINGVSKSLPTKQYQIDFGGNVLTRLEITNNEPKVIGAINGWGNGISKDKITITKK